MSTDGPPTDPQTGADPAPSAPPLMPGHEDMGRPAPTPNTGGGSEISHTLRALVAEPKPEPSVDKEVSGTLRALVTERAGGNRTTIRVMGGAGPAKEWTTVAWGLLVLQIAGVLGLAMGGMIAVGIFSEDRNLHVTLGQVLPYVSWAMFGAVIVGMGLSATPPPRAGVTGLVVGSLFFYLFAVGMEFLPRLLKTIHWVFFAGALTADVASVIVFMLFVHRSARYLGNLRLAVLAGRYVLVLLGFVGLGVAWFVVLSINVLSYDMLKPVGTAFLWFLALGATALTVWALLVFQQLRSTILYGTISAAFSGQPAAESPNPAAPPPPAPKP